PSLRWSAATPRADVLVDSRSIAGLRTDLLDVRCMSGVQCSWTAKIDAADVSLGDWQFGQAQLMSPMQASIGESIEVSISTATAVSGTDIRFGDYKVRAISLREFAGATFTVANGGWQAQLPASTIRLQTLRPLELLESSFDLELQDTQVLHDGDRLESGFRLDPATATVSYRGIDIAVPAAAGTFTIEDDRQSADVRLSGAKRGISAAVSYTERTAGGELRVQDATFDMRRRSLATWLKRRGDAWNVIDGLVRANLTLLWAGLGDDRSYDGQIELNAAGLAGNYEELVFTGLELGLKADVEDDLSARIDPVDVRLGLLDAGVPVTNLEATLIPDLAMSTLQVERLGFEILGGSMHAKPFLWRRDSGRTEVPFEVRRIQPALMLALADFDSVEIDGSLSGVLPLLLVGRKVLIEGGKLSSEAPGGTIRYRPEVPVEGMKKDSSQLGTVTRALGNFHYESLSCDVNYAENGDLRLQMRIQGVNPDMDPNQPVILNLGLDNNVPQLLRSLQATRSIEDILERRASQ
ncbi:MAG: YdbH domain-containing protein, partial [Gammaproteobacteria bacterium]|nr:YdbH domain-containing protein [Gammaproteobacteria bacterium]